MALKSRRTWPVGVRPGIVVLREILSCRRLGVPGDRPKRAAARPPQTGTGPYQNMIVVAEMWARTARSGAYFPDTLRHHTA
ncbi:hypothetical protein FRAAL0445 [Frankia alni ACN14a]|uniref:Uncharacterized protein n=1 Tax=Frankia alni (strain DSM 45986 / CECT 9034 / ACN14a) TaxID=326424 RepID=Q0RTH8_FRAAA|nr:hypothetical protein FRAAL0445 [Frankia alni ACN14a]